VLIVMEDLARGGMTMLLVTHEMNFARNVADVTVFMHQGKIWESGASADMFAAPRTPELQAFLNAGVR
jgi:polar amino acid transport system ATP-binding protein